MNRRALLTGLSALFAARRGAYAQTDKAYRIGHISLMTPAGMAPYVASLEQGLRELGYVRGKDFIIEDSSANENPDNLAEAATQLVQRKVDVIVTGINQGVDASRQATTRIPIVMVYEADPVGMGFTASLGKPGGNITGGTLETGAEVYGKKLQLFREAIPALKQVAFLWNVAFRPGLTYLSATRETAKDLGVRIQSVEVRSANDFERAFASMDHADGVMVVVDPVTFPARARITQLAAKHRLPVVASWSEFTEAGGLMSYGPNAIERWRRAAVYVDKILKGSKPSELPVEQPSTFRMVINLKTAKALGLTIPPSLLARADQIIE
jgi:putative ABC transport system substrate-binding protein